MATTTRPARRTNSYKQMLPGVMADAIMSAGGLGLARTIAQNLKGRRQ